MADWRADNARVLKGQRLHWSKYTKWSDEWDHDHCAGCWAKFSEEDGPDILHEGYTTGPEYRLGARYDWVCAKCFTDLKDVMGWTEAPSTIIPFRR